MTARGQSAPPAPDPRWAYFFDVDGTLSHLAPSPLEARVLPATQELLGALRVATGGAVAFVSGRAIRDIDALLPSDVPWPVAGQHGLERRSADGDRWQEDAHEAMLPLARTRLAALVASDDALLLEDKGLSFAVHYRAAPALERMVHDEVRAIQSELGATYAVQPGAFVVELTSAACNKGDAIAWFMSDEPFRGRTPVFIGDDITDEHGFAMVNRMGGHSIKVGDAASVAQWRLRDPVEVWRWLTRAMLD